VDILLKQRLVGAIVLISLAVIFLPMLFTGNSDDEQIFESSIPAEPVYEIKSPQVSVPLPLPSKTLEKVPLREPVIKQDIQAKTEPQAVSKTTDSNKTKSQKPKTIQPIQQSDSQEKTPAEPAPTVSVSKPTPTPTPTPDDAAAKAVGTAPTVAIKPSNVTGWVVQVGSFSQKANAEKLRDKLRKMGMASFVVTGMSNNKKVHRVRVGPEIDRNDAEKIQAQIKEKTKLSGLVMKYP
jgi:DedD protein